MNTEHFKELLEEELKTLESELSTVGRKNPENPNDWEATQNSGNKEVGEATDEADELDVAEKIEEFENNRGILNQLETRYNEVKKALGKIEEGTYGICEVCGDKIEEDRLEANPAAVTCKNHMQS